MTERTLEYRTLPVSTEVRDENEDGSIPVIGHAAMFNRRSHNLGGFVEVIAPGAFSKTIQEADVRFLKNHNPDLVLARNTNGSLKLEEDDIGLRIQADMAAVTYAQDLAISMARGDVNQMSFAFRTIKDEWDEDPDGTLVRTLREVALVDVSAVTYPAYPQTEVGLRADQFVALMDSLGLSDIEEERRDQFVRNLIERNTNRDDLPFLRAVGERIMEAIGDALPADDGGERNIEIIVQVDGEEIARSVDAAEESDESEDRDDADESDEPVNEADADESDPEQADDAEPVEDESDEDDDTEDVEPDDEDDADADDDEAEKNSRLEAFERRKRRMRHEERRRRMDDSE